MEREATGAAKVFSWVAAVLGIMLVLLGGAYVVCWFALPACGIDPVNRVRHWDMDRKVEQIRQDMQAANSAPLRQNGWAASHGSRYSPLGAFQTEVFSVNFANVSDSVEPLVKHNLSGVGIEGGAIRDLSPLAGLNLWRLELSGTEVTDLSFLNKKQLMYLALRDTKVASLEFLRGVGSKPLQRLDISGSPIADLSPVKGMPLQWVNLARSKVTDLRPLAGMKLDELDITGAPIADLTVLSQITCKKLIMSPAQIEQRQVQEAAANKK